MTVRPYDPEDYEMIALWRLAHVDGPVDPVVLPPCGIVVEDEGGPIAALWCYESAGIGVGHLELPLSRPGLSMAQATEAFRFAVESIMELAGKGWQPQGTYGIFRVSAPPSIARVLSRMGWKRESERELIPMILIRGCEPRISS